MARVVYCGAVRRGGRCLLLETVSENFALRDDCCVYLSVIFWCTGWESLRDTAD